MNHLIATSRKEAESVPVVYAALLQIVFGAYKFMEANNFAIAHNIANQTAVQLMNKGDYVGALHIMNEVSKTRWGRRSGWDLDGLTVLMRAYTFLYDLRGVKWVVDRALEIRQPPDPLIAEYIKRAGKATKSEEQRHELFRQMKRIRDHRITHTKVLNVRSQTLINIMDKRLRDRFTTRPVHTPKEKYGGPEGIIGDEEYEEYAARTYKPAPRGVAHDEYPEDDIEPSGNEWERPWEPIGFV